MSHWWNNSKSRTYPPPSERELTVLFFIGLSTMWITAGLLRRSTDLIFQYGDNSAYLAVSKGILHWDFHNLQIQHFMGYPYVIALVSLVFHIPPSFSLWITAVFSALIAIWIVARMFGTLVAGYFAFTNFAWIQASFLGGSEPLAVALGLGALLAFRRDRIFVAALVGSLAVIVRPLMIFVLVGIGMVLLHRRKFRLVLVVLATGLIIGVLYVLPLLYYFGDPLLTIHSYTRRDYGGGGIVGPHGHLFGWPFHGIVAGTLAYPAPWTNLVLSFFWIGLVLVGTGMMFSKNIRSYIHAYPQEAIFAGLYLLSIFSYDYLLWARSNFIRFAIPVLPFVFFALSPFLPKDRRWLWCLCVLSAVLSMCSAVGIRRVTDRPATPGISQAVILFARVSSQAAFPLDRNPGGHL